MHFRVAAICTVLSFFTFGQQPSPLATPARITVPHLIRISGQLPSGQGTAGINFALYKSQNDTAPLWTETQNVVLDANGKYSALIGATNAEGIPLELFASGEAQWLGIRREGQAELPRILLVSVPYAMKAADAETLSGHTAAEFVTQQNLGEVVQLKLQEPEIRTVLANPLVSGTTPATAGATNFTDSTSNQIIAVTQNGTGRLITGSGPSHTQVFAVDQTGLIHGSGLSLDGSAGRTIGMGNNATSGGAGYQLVVRAGESAVGSTNKRGGQLNLAAGPGTGGGGSGDVVISTAPPGASGTAVNTLIPRHVYASSPVNMGGASGFAVIGRPVVPNGESGVMMAHFKIQASDGSTNMGTFTGDCALLVLGGTETDAYMGADHFEIDGFSGTFEANCALYYEGSDLALMIYDALPFTPIEHTITYELENRSEWPLQLYANTSIAEKMPLPMDPAGAGTFREYPTRARRDANGVWKVVESRKP